MNATFALPDLAVSATERARLDRTCRDQGFFYLAQHGLDTDLVHGMRRQMHAFFMLPRAVKKQLERSKDNVWGYFDQELTKNRRDWKEIFDVGPAEVVGPLAGSTPQWPDQLPQFRVTIENYFAACLQIARQLLEVIADCLTVPASELTQHFQADHTSFLRLNHYPPCADPAPAHAPTDIAQLKGELGIHQHTDAGALTLLLLDEHPALQMWVQGRWQLVQPKGDQLLVNLGDIMQVWSNDRYPAPVHRVLANAQNARLSAPFFLNPAYSTNYAPLVCAKDQQAPRYRSINWGAFRAGRAGGDYADVGEEIQIQHFRI